MSGSDFNAMSGLHEAALYQTSTGTWMPLGGLGGSSGSSMSSGWSISGDGQTVVGLGWIDAGTAHAFAWNFLGGMVDLGSTVVGESSRANGVNLDGSVVVGWQDGAGRQAAAWVNGVQELILDGSGNPAGEAYAVSGDGQWVTGIGYGAGPFGVADGWLCNTVTNATTAIPNLAVGAASRFGCSAVTDDGKTIAGGTWGLGPATFGTAVIWREGIGTMTLADFLDEQGVAYPAAYTFAFVSDMSSDGRWITGWGNEAAGPGNETFIIKLPPCGDLDGNGVVDFGDVLDVLTSWGPCPGCPADIDESGVVNFQDVLFLLTRWGNSC